MPTDKYSYLLKFTLIAGMLLAANSIFSSELFSQEEATSPAQMVQPKKGILASCFDYYKFPGVLLDFKLKLKNTEEVIAGEKLYLFGPIENQTPVAISEGEIHYRLVKVNQDTKRRRSEGDDILSEGVLLGNINLQAKERKEISASYTLPKSVRLGKYALNLYFIVDKKYNWSGLLFTDEVIGSLVPLTVKGKEDPLPHFDRSQTKINNERYTHIGWLKPYRFGSDSNVETVFNNPMSEEVTAKVTTETFFWDGLQEKPLETSEEEVVLSGGESKALKTAISKATLPVYFLRQTARYTDPSTNSEAQNIINVRLLTTATSARFNSLGLTTFPFKEGEKNTLYVCLHATTALPFSGELKLVAKTDEGDVLSTISYKGEITPEVMALSNNFTIEKSARKVILEGEIIDESGNSVDTAKVVYSCEDFDKNLCPQVKFLGEVISSNLKKILGIGVLIASFLLVAGTNIVLRGRKKRNKSFYILIPFFLSFLFAFLATPLKAESQFSSYEGMFPNVIIPLANPFQGKTFVKVFARTSIKYLAEATPTTLAVGEEVEFSVIDRFGYVTIIGGSIDTPFIYFPNDDTQNWWVEPENRYTLYGLPVQSDIPPSYELAMASFIEEEPNISSLRIARVIKSEPTPIPVLDCSIGNNKCRALSPGIVSVSVDFKKNKEIHRATTNYTDPSSITRLGTYDFQMPSLLFDITVSGNIRPSVQCGIVSNITHNSANLSWQFSDPDGDTQSAWGIQGSRDSSFSFLDFNRQEENNATSVTVNNLSHKTKYYWRVAVRDSQSAWSDWVVCNAFSTLDKPDKPPTCQLDIDPDIVYPGQTANISGSASDPDGDEIEWWWVAQGTPVSPGVGPPPQTWKAPLTPGLYKITAFVRGYREGGSCSLTAAVKAYKPPECSGISANPSTLFVGKSTQLRASVSGLYPTYNWKAPPGIGYFDDVTKAEPVYTAPDDLPALGKVRINLTVSNPAGSATCPWLDIPIKDVPKGVLQGRIFNDENGSGMMDEGEVFISEAIGIVSIKDAPGYPQGAELGDGCEIEFPSAFKYRFEQVPYYREHIVSLNLTNANWEVTGAYYTQRSLSCDISGFPAEWNKVSPTLLEVKKVKVWEASPITNLWFGVKAAGSVCRRINANHNKVLVGEITNLSADVSGDNLSYLWTSQGDAGSFDAPTKANPAYTAPLFDPLIISKVQLNLQVTNSQGARSNCPPFELKLIERVIQGRFFKDDGGPLGLGISGNGVKDGDEVFIDPPAGTVVEVRKGGQIIGRTDVLRPPVDSCGAATGIRSSNNLPVGNDYEINVDIQNSEASWKISGVFHGPSLENICTNQPKCVDLICGDMVNVSADKRVYQVSEIDLGNNGADISSVANLWFGLDVH